MSREKLLSRLSVRLTHLVDSSDAELNTLLEKLRHSIKDNTGEQGLHRLSEKLASLMLVHDDKPTSGVNGSSMGDYALEFSQSIKSLQVDKPHRKKLSTLADQLVATTQVEEQL